jgi:hypothetical protein
VAAILTATLTFIPQQLVDNQALGDAVRNGDDLRVTVDVVNDDGDYTIATPETWSLPPDNPLNQHVSSDAALQLMSTIRTHGGFDVGRLRVRLLLEGRRNQQIRVTDIVVTNSKDIATVSGTLVNLHEEGGDGSIEVLFDLNDPLPGARIPEPNPNGPGLVAGNPYFSQNTISLNDREQVVVVPEVRPAANHASEFELSVRYTIGGERRSMTIDNNGQPFRVTPLSCRAGAIDPVYDRIYGLHTGDIWTVASLPSNDIQVRKCV